MIQQEKKSLWTWKKKLVNPSQSIFGSSAVEWNFESIKWINKSVEQGDFKNPGFKRLNSKKRLEKNEHPCSMDTGFCFQNWDQLRYLKPTRHIQVHQAPKGLCWQNTNPRLNAGVLGLTVALAWLISRPISGYTRAASLSQLQMVAARLPSMPCVE